MPGSIDLHSSFLAPDGDAQARAPSAPLDLEAALGALASRCRTLHRIEIECRIQDGAAKSIAPGIASACAEICREALDNAMRHSRARRVSIELVARHGRIIVRVGDDGDGFEACERQSSGIARMEELARRAGGRLELRTRPHAGTCVSALFTCD